MRAWIVLATAVVALGLILTGCGGGDGSDGGGDGKLSVKVVFPAGKVIPEGTNSVVVRVLDPATRRRLLHDTVITRPEDGSEAGAIIGPIRPGPVLVYAAAHATPDGSGPALAEAITGVRVVAGRVVRVGLTLAGITARVTVTPAALDILTTKSHIVNATAHDAVGNVVLGAEFTWTSSDPDVASVSEKGIAEVTGVAPGAATITATETTQGVSGECAVTVTPREPTRVEVLPQRRVVIINWGGHFLARAFDRDGDEIPGETFEWDTEDHSIATIDDNGVVQGLSGGVTRVTAKTSNGVVGTAVADVVLYAVYLNADGPGMVGDRGRVLNSIDLTGFRSHFCLKCCWEARGDARQRLSVKPVRSRSHRQANSRRAA